MKQIQLYFYTYAGDKPGIYYQNCVEFKQIKVHGRITYFVKIVINETELQDLFKKANISMDELKKNLASV